MVSGWASASLSFVHQLTTSQQWPNTIIFCWANSVLKLLDLRWSNSGTPTHHYPTDSAIYQRYQYSRFEILRESIRNNGIENRTIFFILHYICIFCLLNLSGSNEFTKLNFLNLLNLQNLIK